MKDSNYPSPGIAVYCDLTSKTRFSMNPGGESGGSGEECGLCTSLHALASSLPASILAAASDMANHICNMAASSVSMKKHSDFKPAFEGSHNVSTMFQSQ